MTSFTAPLASGEAALELARLLQLTEATPMPPPDLPGWQSLAAREYAEAVRGLVAAVAAVRAAFAAALDAS
jgi:hypothetical protein